MNKSKKPFETKQKKSERPKRKPIEQKPGFFRDKGVRETIESIIVAIILALLFRAYEAEAFVIPTGSMAPTLEGRHLDTMCPKCDFHYLTGASCENPDKRAGYVFETTCPICRFTYRHDRSIGGGQTNEDSFVGDRILVVKFAYEFAEPERWDVIVFKYPGNAKQNYIKRLIGLPGETLILKHGDVYVVQKNKMEIARKPPSKIKAMLQVVDDTHYIPKELKDVNWPSRWQQWNGGSESGWQVDNGSTNPTFKISGGSDDESWLRYRHLVPRRNEWGSKIENGELPERVQEGNVSGELITDYYAYNDKIVQTSAGQLVGKVDEFGTRLEKLGLYWVGDLALEANLQVGSDTGELAFDLVEGGVHFTCRIDLASGDATLQADSEQISFRDEAGAEVAKPTGKTSVNGRGNYRVRFANVDDQLTLWINERVVDFSATKYIRTGRNVPSYSKDKPGDCEPAGIGSTNAAVEISRLKVLRDIYYVSVDSSRRYEYNGLFNGQLPKLQQIRNVMETPELWDTMEGNNLFDMRMSTEFVLEKDQFFPMGDNSPESLDARSWSTDPFVKRELLIGKALFVYWPHPWRPFWPNFSRMGLIR